MWVMVVSGKGDVELVSVRKMSSLILRRGSICLPTFSTLKLSPGSLQLIDSLNSRMRIRVMYVIQQIYSRD